jgi:hypothetical protein
MSGEPDDDATENVRVLIIFPLAHEWKQVLLVHGCTFRELEHGETVIFPEGTTRTLLLSRAGQPTNRSRIQLPDGLELREVLDDEGTGKRWLLLVLSREPMQDIGITRDPLQGKTRGEDVTEEERREQDEWKEPGEQNVQEARALLEKAQVRAGLITVLTRRLESHDDLLARIAAAELRNDPNWRAFTRGIIRYHRRRRKIARKRRSLHPL